MPGRLGELGPYELLDRIGQGGISRVYRAAKEGSEQEVALKQIVLQPAGRGPVLEALRTLNLQFQGLKHRNLVEVYELIGDQDELTIAMELVRGPTLKAVGQRTVKQGAMPREIIVEIALQLCDGLAFLHEASAEDGTPLGLVHGSLNPANIIVSLDGVIKIADFGMAAAELNLLRSPAYAMARGALLYLSPEQVGRRELDSRSDLFSFGVMLAESITGTFLFRGESMDEVLRNISTSRIGDGIAKVEETLPQLVPILERTLKVRPDERWPTARELGAQIEQAGIERAGAEGLATWLDAWMQHKEAVSPLSEDSLDQRARSGEGEKSLVGRNLANKYRLKELIGRGGMGEVYLARQGQTGREVVIKVLTPPENAGVERKLFERLFLREASAAAGLKAPHSITIYDFGQSKDGIFYIVMEYLLGRTVHEWIADVGPFSAERATHVAMQVCQSLKEAHAKGIVHRDLKPANVMLVERNNDPNFTKVLDFGLVKHTDSGSDRSELTLAGKFIGSPKYAAPEQLQSRHDVDQRADIYAFGLLYYYMLTAHPPFEGDMRQIIASQILSPPPPMQNLNPDLDVTPTIENVIYRCLEKNPDHRFQTMGDILVALSGERRAGHLPKGHRHTGDMPAVPSEPSHDPDQERTEDVVGQPWRAPDESPREEAFAPDTARAGVGGRSSRLPLIAVLVVLLLGAGTVAAWFIWNHQKQAGAEDPETTTTTDPEVSGAPEVPVVIEDATPTVLLKVDSTPTGASIFLSRPSSELFLGKAPVTMNIELIDEEVENGVVLVLRRQGYRDQKVQELVVDGALHLTVDMAATQRPIRHRPDRDPTEAPPEQPTPAADNNSNEEGFKKNPYE